jgi:hypothetical protein
MITRQDSAAAAGCKDVDLSCEEEEEGESSSSSEEQQEEQPAGATSHQRTPYHSLIHDANTASLHFSRHKNNNSNRARRGTVGAGAEAEAAAVDGIISGSLSTGAEISVHCSCQRSKFTAAACIKKTNAQAMLMMSFAHSHTQCDDLY